MQESESRFLWRSQVDWYLGFRSFLVTAVADATKRKTLCHVDEGVMMCVTLWQRFAMQTPARSNYIARLIFQWRRPHSLVTVGFFDPAISISFEFSWSGSGYWWKAKKTSFYLHTCTLQTHACMILCMALW